MTGNKNVDDFISEYVFDSNLTILYNFMQLETLAINNIEFKNIVFLDSLNDVRRINKFLILINKKIVLNGIFIGKAILNKTREYKIKKRYSFFLNKFIIFFNFLFHRVLCKLPYINKLYFIITKGKGRWLSKAEILGRLVSCGFYILDYKEINDDFFFAVKKVSTSFPTSAPSYWPIIKLERVGQYGRIIHIYKFRTMHPYSEHIQGFIIKKFGYDVNGKPANDFRLTSWGKFLRKYWLDELPQIINCLKGDLSIVGVRPLSKRFLKEYPEDLMKERLRYKPGCIPPYVALRMQNVQDYIQSEKIYFQCKKKRRFLCDIKIFFLAIYNIFTKKIKSA